MASGGFFYTEPRTAGFRGYALPLITPAAGRFLLTGGRPQCYPFPGSRNGFSPLRFIAFEGKALMEHFSYAIVVPGRRHG